MKNFISALVTLIVINVLPETAFPQSLAVNTDGSTANTSALLDVKSTTKGILIPRLTRSQRNAIASPATGLMIFQSGPDSIGLYYYNGTGWTWVLSNSNSDSLAWRTGGNTATVDASNFIGTTDNIPFNIRVNNQRSGRIDPSLRYTFFGYQSGNAISTGTDNTAYGYLSLTANTSGFGNIVAGRSALKNNTTGYRNTAIGDSALFNNTTGYSNVAIGTKAQFNNPSLSNLVAIGDSSLFNNSTGTNNTAIGSKSMYSNTAGYHNTAVGKQSLFSNTNGNNNIAAVYGALYSNINGGGNIANGLQTLYSNTSGSDNIALGTATMYFNSTGYANCAAGAYALENNTIGYNNTAFGYSALISNTNDIQNVANGTTALNFNTTGMSNSAIGYNAMRGNTSGNNNAALGNAALFTNTTGSNNTAIGTAADVSSGTLTNATALGYFAVVNASNKIRLGNASVTVIEGQVAYTFPSDGRFKTNVSETDVKGLDFITRLRPVVNNFDTRKFEEFLTRGMSSASRTAFLSQDYSASSSIRQSGFIAQEVELAAQASGYNFNGLHKPENENDHYSIAYSQFVVPLVKGMQEQQVMILELKKENQELMKKVKAMELLMKTITDSK
ncbi:MAG: tail fiber domain-containing protein [Ferruginibacter sp.]